MIEQVYCLICIYMRQSVACILHVVQISLFVPSSKKRYCKLLVKWKVAESVG